MTKEDTIMENNGRTYRGVPVPDQLRKAEVTGFQDDPYVIGWKDGVDASLTQDMSGTPDAPQDMSGTPDAPQDMSGTPDHDDALARDMLEEMPPELKAFLYVTLDNVPCARDVLSTLSGRDRAVLVFWLKELEGLVDDLEVSRRMSR